MHRYIRKVGLHLKRRKILFVTPPYRCGVVDVIGRWPPLGFVYLAGSARLAGLDAEIYDARAKDHGYPEIEQQFRRSDASYIASTAITASIDDSVKTLELAKSINPDVVTILGGLHSTLCYEEVLTSTAAVDYIVCGEGETTLRELLRTLEDGGDPGDVPGLAFRRNGAIVKTARRDAAGSPDDLPAAWDLLDWQEYRYFVLPGSRLGAINTSRAGGLRESCRPATPSRYRDPHKVVAEIVHLHEAYGVDVFLITDDSPTGDRERWELILDLVMERSLPVCLLMQTCTADIIRDRDILWKYRKAGVVHIYIALKTAPGDPVDREGGTTTDPKLVLDSIREHGIISEASFVVGGPDETREGLERALKLAQEYNPDNAQFQPLTPWPGDHAYDDVRQYVRVHDYAKYNLIDPVIEPKQLSLHQVDSAIMNFHRRFYMGKMMEVLTMKDTFKRDYLLTAMKLMMVNPYILRKLGMGALGRVPAKIGKMMR